MKEFQLTSSKVFDIARNGELMIYIYKPGTVVDYLTENEMLFQILSTYGVSPFIWDGRIRFQLQVKDEHPTYRIHDLAYACYHGHIKSFDTWQTEMQAFLDWKRFNGLTVDHADSNGHNNTSLNLSLMPGSLNCAKGDIVSRFRVPVYLTTAYVDGEYRVLVIWDTVKTNVGDGFASIYLLCEDAEAFVDCLRSLSRIDPEWYQALRDSKGWKKNGNPCALSDIGKSVAAQIGLSQMNREEFDLYRLDGLQGRFEVKKVERVTICEPSIN